jgi:enoyl-CoA hydratase/carnithine racemase
MKFIKCTQNDLVQTWQISRPDRGNSLGTVISAELAQLMSDLKSSVALWLKTPEEKLQTRVLVISADPMINGERRTWIAGGDLKELAALSKPKDYAQTMTTILRDLERLPIPVIMRIDGAAIGGGAELALAGDLRYATESSSMSFKQLLVGLATGYGSAKRIVDLVGLSKAKELLFLSQSIDAKKCLELGLITESFSDISKMDLKITETINHFLALEPQAIAAQKIMFNKAVLPDQITQAAELNEFTKIWRNPTHESFLRDF